VAFSAAQYPWVAEIALHGRLESRVRGRCPAQIRFVVDLQTLLVSGGCVCVSALNSVGVSSSRLWLLVTGAVGLAYYGVVRSRWARWLRRSGESAGRSIEIVARSFVCTHRRM
jgi:hypothetical protein